MKEAIPTTAGLPYNHHTMSHVVSILNLVTLLALEAKKCVQVLCVAAQALSWHPTHRKKMTVIPVLLVLRARQNQGRSDRLKPVLQERKTVSRGRLLKEETPTTADLFIEIQSLLAEIKRGLVTLRI